MKLLFDFFPIFLFFIVYKMVDIYAATAVLMASSFIQVTAFWIKHRRFETMHLITLGLVLVLGGATLFLHDENFIKWKPTVVNWLFAVAFLGSQFIGDKNFVQRMMGGQVELPSHIWRHLNLSWVAFFILSGAVNLYVAFNYDTDTWVNFKLFGMLGLTFVFVIAQGIYLSRFMEEPEPETETKTEPES